MTRPGNIAILICLDPTIEVRSVYNDCIFIEALNLALTVFSPDGHLFQVNKLYLKKSSCTPNSNSRSSMHLRPYAKEHVL